MNAYEILGLNPGASVEQVKEAYKRLAAQYQLVNFAEGTAEYAYAKNKMNEINKAYDEIIMGNASSNSSGNNYSYSYSNDYSNFSDIRNMIDSNRLDDAEMLLEGISPISRNAEWYYLKGLLMKKRGWLEQAFDNFSQAYRMNPNNFEYKNAYENMNNQNNGGYRAEKRGYNGNNKGCLGDCSACDVCSSLLCADCCCECMGGDLIPCC